MIIILT